VAAKVNKKNEAQAKIYDTKRCFRTQSLDFCQEESIFIHKTGKKYCGFRKIAVPLHRQTDKVSTASGGKASSERLF